MESDAPRDRPRNLALTGIRGLAACWVVVFHAYEALQSLNLVPVRDHIPIIRSGYLGVDLFFLLSGFILTMTYAGTMHNVSIGGIRHFVIGRLFRILPLHWFVLSVLAAAVLLVPWAYWGPGPFTLRSFVASVFLVQGWIGQPIAWNAPTWSLSAEWLGYLFFLPLIVVATRIRRPMASLCCYGACLAPFFMILIVLHATTLDHAERLGDVRCLCEFAAGVMLCRLFQTIGRANRVGTWTFWIGLAGLGTAVAFRSFETVAVFGFSCLIFSSAVLSVPSRVVFGNRVVHFLGEISYSIYLSHLTLINVGLALARATWSQQIGGWLPLVLVVFCSIIVIPLSWVTWRLIEIPSQRLGRRLSVNNLQRCGPVIGGAARLETAP